MARIQGFQRWLTATTVISPTGDYRHRVLAENALEWTAIQPHIKRYFRKAHADAVKHLRKMAGVSLHPLKKRDPAVAPTRHYPHGLDPMTLKGYFGEVLAYAIVECMGAAGYSEWDVPAYLFRFHTVAFQCLETRRDQPQRFRHVIVLLDEGFRQRQGREVVLRGQHRLVEVGMLKQFHAAGPPWLATARPP
jgi:hypothetical protein